MPQALAAIIVTAIGLTGTVATIVSSVLTLAITVGLNFVAQSIFGRSGVAKPSDGQRIIRQTVGSRVRHYGRVRLAGTLTFYESRNGTLYMLVTTGHGKISSVVEYLINGKPVTVDGSGVVTSISYTHKGTTYRPIRMHVKNGDAAQSAFSQLTSVFSEWTTNHRQRGCSALLVIAGAVRSEYFADIYEGSREPEGAITADTSMVYDPRKDSTAIIGYSGETPIMGSGAHRIANPSTWEFSDNWALCFADYLAHADGYGLGYDMINWTNIAQEADECDETVTTADDEEIARWRVGGSYRLSIDERRAVVREFLKAGDGFMFQDANGLANIRSGRWMEPTVHIPEKHILSATATLGPPPMDRANEVRVVYTEPALGYTETEATPLVDAAAQSELGRAEVSRFDAYFCPHHNQAQRIGYRILKRLGRRWNLTIKTNLYGLNAIGERFVSVTLSELAIDALAFEVNSFKIDTATMSVEIGLTQVEEADFNLGEAETTAPEEPPSTSLPIDFENIGTLTITTQEVALTGADGLIIRATWPAPSRVDLVGQLQYREDGASEWLEMTVSQEDRAANSPVLSSASDYEVRGRLLTASGRAGYWSATYTVSIVAPSTPPSTPTGFFAEGGALTAYLSWTNPTEPGFHHCEVWRAATNNFAAASKVGVNQYGGLGQIMEYYLTLATGTHYLWLRAADGGGTLTAPTAVQEVVISSS